MTTATQNPPSPDSASRLFLHRYSGDLIVPLARLVEQAKGGDPLAPVTVVCPTVYSNLTLRRALGRTGLVNVKFLVFSRLSEFLGAPALAAQGHRPLTPIIEGAAVRTVSGRTTGALAALRSHPATIRALRNTFREVRHATDVALDRLAGQGGLREEVAGLYRDFRHWTEDYYDAEDLARSAAGEMRIGGAAGLADLGFIVFFLVRSMTPGERELAQALAERGVCSVFLGLTGEPEADAQAEHLAGHFSRYLGSPERQGTSEEAAIPSKGLSPGGNRLLIAPGPHEEVRWAIRQLARQAEEGTPFHRMAVLYGTRTPYETLVREELQLAGLPTSGPDGAPLARTAVGRVLRGLLDLSGGDFNRHEVMEWLVGSPVQIPGVLDGEIVSPSYWDAISRKAGVISGVAQWQERLERYAGETERSAGARERKGEISEAQAALMLAEARTARNLARFVNTLASDINPPEAPAGGSLSWDDYTGWTRDLFERYMASPGQLPEHEQAASERVIDILDSISAAGEIEPSPTIELFRETLEEALQSPVGRSGETGRGVFVGPIGSAAGMNFDTLHIVGMIEGAVPSHSGGDPLLPDPEREAAGGPVEGLPLQRDSLAEERHAFLYALASTPEATLSYPRADPAGQRSHYPSRWFTGVASVMEGAPVYTSGLSSLGTRDWLTVIPSMERALDTIAGAAPADLYDYDMERLGTWKQAGLRVSGHPLATSGILKRSLELGRGRYASQRLTEWDGNVSTVAQETGFAKRLEDSPLSATSLEQWAACPFRYFASHVLRISALEDREELFSISALDRGSLVHQVLEEFIEAVKREDSMPQPGNPWTARQRESLDRIAGKAFRQAESEGKTGRALMWQLEQRNILDDLHDFLEADTALRARFGMYPAYSEAAFGMGGDSWPAPELGLCDASVRFRGYIDRVDASPGHSRVLVMDYKTGSSYSYRGLKDDPIDRGRHLQLAVYSMAARSALGLDSEVRAAYWFVSNRGRFETAPADPVDISDEETLERFMEGVSTIVAGIKSGLFPANPGPPSWGDFENCRYCDFKALCPARKDALWARKKGHPGLDRYLELSGETPS